MKTRFFIFLSLLFLLLLLLDPVIKFYACTVGKTLVKTCFVPRSSQKFKAACEELVVQFERQYTVHLDNNNHHITQSPPLLIAVQHCFSHYGLGPDVTLLPKIQPVDNYSIIAWRKAHPGPFNIKAHFLPMSNNFISISTTSNNFDRVRKKIQQAIQAGKSVVFYPEAGLARRYRDPEDSVWRVKEFRSGVFAVGHELGLSVLPVVFDPTWTPRTKELRMKILSPVASKDYKDGKALAAGVREIMQAGVLSLIL